MKTFIIFLCAVLLSTFAHSQGCIIVRNVSGLGQYNLTSNSFSTANWQFSNTSRYFKAYRDYIGDKDQHTPLANQNDIRSFSTDFEITRLLIKGWSLELGFPVSANSRTTDLEHGGPFTSRHTTRAFGMGDLHLTVYKWLFKPTEKGNIQLGLGIKFPTADFRKQDYFYRNDTTRILSLVNPSIQLGDGGTGVITELNAFYFLGQKKTYSLYGNFYYLTNPVDVNGTQYTQGKPETPVGIRLGSYDVSVPDVYSMRFGLDYNTKNWTYSLGLRDEGVPVHDLFGKSNGIRRDGYTLSGEPGVTYKFKNAAIYFYVPFLVAHRIKQSVLEKAQGVHSTGGSGDYQIFFGVQFQL